MSTLTPEGAELRPGTTKNKHSHVVEAAREHLLRYSRLRVRVTGPQRDCLGHSVMCLPLRGAAHVLLRTRVLEHQQTGAAWGQVATLPPAAGQTETQGPPGAQSGIAEKSPQLYSIAARRFPLLCPSLHPPSHQIVSLTALRSCTHLHTLLLRSSKKGKW